MGYFTTQAKDFADQHFEDYCNAFIRNRCGIKQYLQENIEDVKEIFHNVPYEVIISIRDEITNRQPDGFDRGSMFKHYKGDLYKKIITSMFELINAKIIGVQQDINLNITSIIDDHPLSEIYQEYPTFSITEMLPEFKDDVDKLCKFTEIKSDLVNCYFDPK